MKCSFKRSLSVALATLTLAACGQATTNAAKVQAAVVADGQPITAPLFYNFPLSEHKETYVRRADAPADDSQSGWTYSVAKGDGGDYVLSMFDDRNNYSYITYKFNLTTGGLSQKPIHNAGTSVAAPASGGDIETNLVILSGLQAALEAGNAPQDVVSYVKSVRNYIVNTKFNAVTVAWTDPSPDVELGKDRSFKLTYTALSDRDLLVKMTDEDESYQPVLVGSTRVTVHAGSGTAIATLRIPQKTLTGSRHLCFTAQIIAAGAPDPKDYVPPPNNSCLSVK